MSFEEIRIRDALKLISRQRWVLPAIQREFVWNKDQVVRLFDSLMRGYPIGSFLLWQLSPTNKANFQFYRFLEKFHERDSTHNPKAELPQDNSEVRAVLDGQQRLTSLYIGLNGTYTEKRKYARRSAASSWPEKRLYLNLTRDSEDTDLVYDFRFREGAGDVQRDDNGTWFRVGLVVSFKKLKDVDTAQEKHELTKSERSRLVDLYETLKDEEISYFLVSEEQSIDHVLDIFVRVNSGGTKLTHSDLLLAIATAYWDKPQARDEIHHLVDEVNRDLGAGFSFTKDFVLKCCLMLADLDLKWRVENFTKPNMQKIEAMWPEITQAIRLTVRLLVR